MTHVQTHTPTAVVLSGSHLSTPIEQGLMDSNGGVTLTLPEATRLALLPTSGLRCIEIEAAPSLKTLDLRALDQEAIISLQLSNVPALREILLGEMASARIHLDAGAAPPGSLVISCGTQQSELMVVVEPGGHVGRSLAGLSTCPRGGVDPRRR